MIAKSLLFLKYPQGSHLFFAPLSAVAQVDSESLFNACTVIDYSVISSWIEF